MARTNIVANIQTANILQPYPTPPITPGAASPTRTSIVDPTDRSTVLVDGKTMVMAYNSDNALARTITFTSVPDSLNRTGHITDYSVAVDQVAIFGPFKSIGWAQTGNLLYIDVSDPTLQISVLTLP